MKKWMLIALALAVAACESEIYPRVDDARPTVTPTEPKVVILVIDGPRYQDSFGDPTHAHIDQIWSQLRPLGTLCSNFQNLGWTVTIPGHSTMLSGVWQYVANDGSERPHQPTMFEYYRKATGAPASDAVLVGGKPKLSACAYSTDAAYGASFGAAEDVQNNTDFETYDHLVARLDADHPRFVMASFSQVDQFGHSGVWADYIHQMDIVDSLAVLTWNHLQSDPVYANQTYMFITADHGRHDDAHGGFQNHGDTCPGCQHVIFLALGPNVRPDFEVTNLYTQRDLCTTVGRILGVPTPKTNGFMMEEIFEPISTGVGD